VLIGVLCWAIKPQLSSIILLVGADPRRVLLTAAQLAKLVGIRLAGAALLVGFADYVWQATRSRQALRMTTHERRREEKEMEGEPLLRASRREAHRALLQQRPLADVASATLIVVDPAFASIAICYDPSRESCPFLWMKAHGRQAQNVQIAASEAGIPIFIDRPLARDLGTLEEGDRVPERLWGNIAELMARSGKD
jgi:flagellar biosynthesis protein FlhB